MICSDSWDKDHVSLLPLEGIYSIDHDVLFEQLNLFCLRLQFFESLLHDDFSLCLIGSDDSHCSLSIKQTLDNQPKDLTFRLIGKRITFSFLLTVFDINKDDISILEATQKGRCYSFLNAIWIHQPIIVEPLTWKMANHRCHSILDVQKIWLYFGIQKPLEQGSIEKGDIAIRAHTGCW